MAFCKWSIETGGIFLLELTHLITSAEEGYLLRRVALSTLGMSHTQFKRAKFHGALLLDDRLARANERVNAGQRLVVRLPEESGSRIEPYPLPLSIPYRDEGLLVIDKPAPLPSVPSRKGGLTLENAIYSHLGCPANFVYHPVNRLDKGTSGLMVVALTPHVQQRLQAALHTDAFFREYLAVCEGAPRPAEGIIRQPIAKADGASIRRQVEEWGKPAVTHYRVLKQANGRCLLSLLLETGRTHQIRVHLAWLGCPVVGDFLYGREDGALPGRFALHSHRLKFISPVTGERVFVESLLPKEFNML